jgi:hypothetical protein
MPMSRLWRTLIGMLGQTDRFLTTRLFLPWLPLFVIAHRQGFKALTPTVLGSLALLLSARLLADGSFRGVLQLTFGFLPLLGSVTILASDAGAQKDLLTQSYVYYLDAALGTALAVVSEVRGRR